MTNEQKFHKRLAAVGFSRGDGKDGFGGCINFQEISAVACRDLINCGCADPNGNQNASPTFEEITVFLEHNPSFVGHGYIVVPTRSDHRISLEGVIAKTDPPEEEVREFVKMFRQADEFDLDRYRAWYD